MSVSVTKDVIKSAKALVTAGQNKLEFLSQLYNNAGGFVTV